MTNARITTVGRSALRLTAALAATGERYFFESTYAPNVVWIDYSRLDFSKGSGEKELKVEKRIFSLNGDVTKLLQPAKPLVFGMNKR